MLSSTDPRAGLRQALPCQVRARRLPARSARDKLLGNLQAQHSGSSSLLQLPCCPCSVVPQRSCEPASLTGAFTPYVPSVNKGFRKQGTSTRALVTITPPKGRSCQGKMPRQPEMLLPKISYGCFGISPGSLITQTISFPAW